MHETASFPARAFWIIAALIVVGGFSLRIWQLGEASLWYDEVLTETRAQASWDQFFTRVLESGNQTPLYFASLHLFPSHNEFWLRLPSALAGTLGIALLSFVTLRLYADRKLALIAGALIAVNPYHIWLSRNARPYALLFVVSLLASYYFLLLLRGERSRRNWIGFTLFSMAAYITHYFAAALPMAQYILFAFILRGNRGFFRRWLRAQIGAVIPLMVWIVALMRQETVAFGIGWIPRPGLDDLPLTLWNMHIGYDSSLPWYLIPGLIVAGYGLGTGLVHAVLHRKENRIDFYWFWLIMVPIGVAFVVSMLRPLYVDRYFIVFLPALLLLTARGWIYSARPQWTSAALAGIVVLSSISSVLIALDEGQDQKEDWRAAAAYIEQEREPGDGLLLEAPVSLVVLRRYLDDQGMPRAWLLNASAWTTQYDEPVQRVWAVYRNPNDNVHIQGVLPAFDPFEPGDSPMAAWLIERRDRVMAQKGFNGMTVLLVDVAAEFAEGKP